LQWIKSALLDICSKIDLYEESKKKSSLKNDFFFISIKHDGIYLSDIKIIDKKAELQMAIFKILLRHHTLSSIESKRSSLNAYQIAAELEKQGFAITDVERQIRQAIYKIKTNILKSHDRRAFEEVILSQIGYGYYIGKNVVIISAEK
jgi:hypothetical protein